MSDITADLTPEQCIPDVPDTSAIMSKLQTELGRRPNLDFFPPDFNLDISKFFSFDMFGKILGKAAGGLDFDTCAVCIDGDIDGALAGGPLYPETMGSQLESIDEGISGLQDQINSIGDSAP
jgi:hypothetical protein